MQSSSSHILDDILTNIMMPRQPPFIQCIANTPNSTPFILILILYESSTCIGKWNTFSHFGRKKNKVEMKKTVKKKNEIKIDSIQFNFFSLGFRMVRMDMKWNFCSCNWLCIQQLYNIYWLWGRPTISKNKPNLFVNCNKWNSLKLQTTV